MRCIRPFEMLNSAPASRAIKQKPFKFFTQVINHPLFLEVISHGWNSLHPLYHSRSTLKLFQTKLKGLKSEIQGLNKDMFGDLLSRVEHAYDDLCLKQTVATDFPSTEAFEEVSAGWEH
ncbi:hypothetical protein F2Q70_00017143 [Brassica cretica]|uniref:Uncharacterized protein n=1 Tax=Brassica cretica TaxID=69181 RepID=A0A3N6RHW0_BRACR|nr:hypothetical protein F2Q70_00017143 [Brassica cretica]KAF2598038.1 hypothetical protein F2Q68_00010097 [Brassica cretica]